MSLEGELGMAGAWAEGGGWGGKLIVRANGCRRYVAVSINISASETGLW